MFIILSLAVMPPLRAEESMPMGLNPQKDFWVTLPREPRAFPESLPAGKAPGFKWRGIKGWMWTPEQYLAEIPVLARYQGNFLMNCYGSMCDLEHFQWGDPKCNRWWEPLPAGKKTAYETIVRRCQESGITFCFSMNPNLSSSRFVNDGTPESVDLLYQHYAWMQGLGVHWFNISLDDITTGINAAGQAKVVNEILARLRARDPGVQMVFCPTFYSGDGTGKEQQPYLETLARELDEQVYLFWTGDSIVKVTRKAAESFRHISGHRLFLWDNYPVNDNHPTMHLGPLINRDPDINEVVDGYMSNSMCKQNEINRIPMLTCLDYAWNPDSYNPSRSIGQAILHLAESSAQRQVLKDLVEAYPGMLIYGNGNTGFNAVQYQFQQITAKPHSREVAAGYLENLQGISSQLKKQFPGHYQPEAETLDGDIQTLKARFAAHYESQSGDHGATNHRTSNL